VPLGWALDHAVKRHVAIDFGDSSHRLGPTAVEYNIASCAVRALNKPPQLRGLRMALSVLAASGAQIRQP